jgi:hypothetical protein
MRPITKEDEIEFILRSLPEALHYLIKKGVCGISCGESFSATLESVAKEREFSDSEINNIVIDLNNFLVKSNVQIIES